MKNKIYYFALVLFTITSLSSCYRVTPDAGTESVLVMKPFMFGDGGIDKNQLIVCHRGFTPNGVNPHGFRNVPDYAMAMKIKNKTKLPMLFDPSHTGGSVNNVLKIAKESSKYDFDGMVIEVHTDPINALTDAKQQLTWEQFDTLLPILKFRNKASYI